MTQNQVKPKILIVDDEAANLNFLRLEFKKDYQVLTAKSGEVALEILKKKENSDIALILVDQVMPGGMSGTELLKHSIDTHPHTIRMIITAYPVSNSNEFKELQVYRFITKPLKEKIQELRESFEKGIHYYNLNKDDGYL